MSRIFRFLGILVLLTGCGRQGCTPGEKITVVYRGPDRLEQTAQIIRENEPIGFIDEVLSSSDGQRVVIQVSQASLLTDKDTFRPFSDPRGKTGFQVTRGPGNPLAAGAVVEADPSWNSRAYYATAITEENSDFTLPSGTPLPYPKALTAPQVPREKRIEQRFAKRVAKSLEVKKKEPLRVDAVLLQSYSSLQEQVNNKPPQEVKAILEREGKPLLAGLEAYADEALKNRNMEAFGDSRQLINRLRKLEARTNSALRRMEAAKNRPQKERWVPPDFR